MVLPVPFWITRSTPCRANKSIYAILELQMTKQFLMTACKSLRNIHYIVFCFIFVLHNALWNGKNQSYKCTYSLQTKDQFYSYSKLKIIPQLAYNNKDPYCYRLKQPTVPCPTILDTHWTRVIEVPKEAKRLRGPFWAGRLKIPDVSTFYLGLVSWSVTRRMKMQSSGMGSICSCSYIYEHAMARMFPEEKEQII